MNKTTEKAAEWWNDPQSQPSGGWVEVPSVGENINRRASDDPAIDWLNHSAIFLSNQPKPVKSLSVGCGFGIIERVLRQRDICQTIDGLDVAEKAIQGARKKAEDEGLKGLSYHVADLNTVSLPEETYDVVYAHAALHHVFQLEHLLDQIKKTLADRSTRRPPSNHPAQSSSGNRRAKFRGAVFPCSDSLHSAVD